MKEWLTVRNGIGLLLLAMFFKTAGSAMGGGFDNAGPALVAMVFLILAGMFFSKSLCGLLSKPFTRFIDTIYFGNDDRDPPPVNLKLAGIYRQERRFDEAIAEYERQLEFHPRSPQLWGEMISTAREWGNRDLAQELHRRALRKVKRDDRLLLERQFSRM